MQDLVRGLKELGLGTCDGTLEGTVSDLGMLRLLMRHGIRYAEDSLKEAPESDLEDRACLNGMRDAHLDVMSAIDATFVQIVKPAFSNPDAITRLLSRRLKENFYAQQAEVAAKCFAIMKRKEIPFRGLSLRWRQQLKLALSSTVAGRPTREELCGEGFDREMAELADSEPVQTVLHTDGPKAAAGKFLALCLGVPASTGRRHLKRYRERKRVT